MYNEIAPASIRQIDHIAELKQLPVNQQMARLYVILQLMHSDAQTRQSHARFLSTQKRELKKEIKFYADCLHFYCSMYIPEDLMENPAYEIERIFVHQSQQSDSLEGLITNVNNDEELVNNIGGNISAEEISYYQTNLTYSLVKETLSQ